MRRASRARPAPVRSARPALTRPVVWVPILLAVLAIGAFGFQVYREITAERAARTALVAEIEAETGKATPDGGELSRLSARLGKLPDHQSARDLRAASARIDLARDRPERAFASFGNLASEPGATAAEQRLGAAILLRLSETGTGDAAAGLGMMQQVAALSESAYQDGQDPADMLRAWQAATRMSAADAAARFAERLATAHPDSPARRLVQLVGEFESDPRLPLARLDEVRAEFAVPPIEIESMRCLAVLQGGDLEGAVAAVEAVLARAPGVVPVRWAAALVFHACALSHAEGSAPRQQWTERRNQQLRWLLERGPTDDKRRKTWESMLALR